MSLNMRSFLLALQKLSEASDIARYAYSYPSNRSVPKKHFADNCTKYGRDIESSVKGGSVYQVEMLRSIARHVKNQNLMLAQEVVDKLDPQTKKLIPKAALDFISRYS